MKQPLKVNQFKLPLIEQKQNSSQKVSKSTTKRSQFSTNSSQINVIQKQKNFPKLSKFHQQHDKRTKQDYKVLNLKNLTKTTPDKLSQSESDFQEKIKQNKVLLKKHKLKKQLQKRTKSISRRLDKENISELDKLPEIKSKKVLDKKRSNKKYLSFLANTDSKQWVGSIMKGPNLKRSKSNQQNLPKIHQYDKLSGSDVFENIHLFLKGLQSDVFVQDKMISKQKIYSKLLKYKQKLKRMQPNSQFLRTLDQNIQTRGSIYKQSSKTNNLHMMTESQWGKISMNRRQVKLLASTFDEQMQKINTYLNKSSTCLQELLKNRMVIIDLVMLKKLKQKGKIDKQKINGNLSV